VEIKAIGIALQDTKKYEMKKAKIFSDSMSGIMMIRDMKEEGKTAGLSEVMTGIINMWEEVEMMWIPGDKVLYRNTIVEKKAKTH